MIKKIILILILTVTVNTYAVVSITGDNSISSTGGDNTGFTSGGGNNTGFTSGGGNNTGFTSGGGDNTGFTSGGGNNVMLGGGDSNSAAGAGLGSSQQSQSELYRTPNYTPKNVPKVSIGGIIYWLVDLMNSLVYLIIGISLVLFLYGILKLSFIDGQKPEAREQATKFMFWGIVSLFVMVSVWGLVNILKMTFFGGNLILPQLR